MATEAMIIRALLLISPLVMFYTLYPKKSTWGLVSVGIRGISFSFRVRELVVVNMQLESQVEIRNPNLFGSDLKRAKYEVFLAKSKYGTHRMGVVDVGTATVPGRGSVLVPAKVSLENMDIVFLLNLLRDIWRNSGLLNIIALGTAEVHTAFSSTGLNKTLETRMLVGAKCAETVQLLWSTKLARLERNPSKDCAFTYQWLPHTIRNSSALPFIDRKYLVENMPIVL